MDKRLIPEIVDSERFASLVNRLRGEQSEQPVLFQDVAKEIAVLSDPTHCVIIRFPMPPPIQALHALKLHVEEQLVLAELAKTKAGSRDVLHSRIKEIDDHECIWLHSQLERTSELLVRIRSFCKHAVGGTGR